MIEYIIGLLALVIIICAISWYRIVSPSEAHLVVTPHTKFTASPDEKIGTTKFYFKIPEWIPFLGRVVRIMDITIREKLTTQETYEKDQARYKVSSSLKYRITDVKKASETFTDGAELERQIDEVVKSSVRAVTVKYDVNDARAKKKVMEGEIRLEMTDDLEQWGLALISFQLVDFQDIQGGSVISDISKRREVAITSKTREDNAEKIKQARIKEAEADEKSQKREIERDKVVGEEEQIKKQKIAEKEKEAQEKHYEVIKVQTIKQANIDKEKAIVHANQKKETEAVLREQKKLEGEGDRLRAEEQAKGDAAPILEKGMAEAKAKDALQAALNKFKDEAIRALIAEKVVDKDKEVGIATAKALEQADLKVFSGGESDRQGFDLGKLIASTSVADESTAMALGNKLARPNDIGLAALALHKEPEDKKSKTKKTAVKTDKQKE